MWPSQNSSWSALCLPSSWRWHRLLHAAALCWLNCGTTSIYYRYLFWWCLRDALVNSEMEPRPWKHDHIPLIPALHLSDKSNNVSVDIILSLHAIYTWINWITTQWLRDNYLESHSYLYLIDQIIFIIRVTEALINLSANRPFSQNRHCHVTVGKAPLLA